MPEKSKTEVERFIEFCLLTDISLDIDKLSRLAIQFQKYEIQKKIDKLSQKQAGKA